MSQDIYDRQGQQAEASTKVWQNPPDKQISPTLTVKRDYLYFSIPTHTPCLTSIVLAIASGSFVCLCSAAVQGWAYWFEQNQSFTSVLVAILSLLAAVVTAIGAFIKLLDKK